MSAVDAGLQALLDKAFGTAVGEIRREFKDFRTLQLQTAEQLSELLAGFQLLKEASFQNLQGGTSESLKSAPKMVEPLVRDPVAQVPRSRSNPAKIPSLEDLEMQIIRQASFGLRSAPLKSKQCSPVLPSDKALEIPASVREHSDPNVKSFCPVLVQPPPDPPNPPRPLPGQLEPQPPKQPNSLLGSEQLEAQVPPLAERRLSTSLSGQGRGSGLDSLSRHTVTQILTNRTSDPGTTSKIFLEKIGVRLWLDWSNMVTFIIILMSLCELVLSALLFNSGWRHHAELKTTSSLMVFSILAILLLRQMKRTLHSEDLNKAIELLDNFVRDSGQGLDWGSVAKKQWIRLLVLWAMFFLSFSTFQAVELGIEIPEVGSQSFSEPLLLLKVMILVTNSLSFAVCSLVVTNCADFLYNLLVGLEKTLDCWCADIMERPDFISGIESWNSLQALLKCAGREITPSFTALNLLGYAGILVALASFFSLLLDVAYIDSWSVVLHESGLIPFLYLFIVSVILFAKGASLSGKCRQVPAFVNQLGGDAGADTDRQYLVQFISDSAAGFIVHGVTLSRSDLLKQLHILIAILSGLAGALMRRHY
ncbi:unnamed protein product [Symbiodinium natans]|uniref:Uncharacterized protein n=1 Tax=Symbiodinium natans TaxID=878477 RepID=A0A812PJI6_9DINO|nr:unnamed protein product [Symbiodinium natans]